jgi:hypothetical protein
MLMSDNQIIPQVEPRHSSASSFSVATRGTVYGKEGQEVKEAKVFQECR